MEPGIYYVGGETLMQATDDCPTLPVWKFDKAKKFEHVDIECWCPPWPSVSVQRHAEGCLGFYIS